MSRAPDPTEPDRQGQNRTKSDFVRGPIPDRHGHTPIGVVRCAEDDVVKEGRGSALGNARRAKHSGGRSKVYARFALGVLRIENAPFTKNRLRVWRSPYLFSRKFINHQHGSALVHQTS